MTDMFVVDASMALSWHFADEETVETAAVEELSDRSALIVPGHWFAEVSNTLVIGERRGRATMAESVSFIERLTGLDVRIDEIAPVDYWERVIPLARAHGLTVYDTLYLELAERRGLALASLDAELNAAARSVGVPLIGEVA